MTSKRTTEELVCEWRSAIERVEAAKLRMAEANEELKNAIQRLGDRINPGDQRGGEKITMWVRVGGGEEKLIESARFSDGHYYVNFRGERG